MSLLRSARSVSSEALARVACALGLVALPLMVASLFFPTVWPVLIALSVGQGIGTLSFVLYLIVVARDLDVWTRLRVRGQAARDP